MAETVTTFEIDILKHNISLTSDTILNVSDSQDKLQILENNRLSQQQFIQLCACKLWQVTFYSPKYPTKTFNTLETPEICG